MKFDLTAAAPRQGWLTLADGQRLPTPIVVPLFHQATTSPLLVQELESLDLPLIATDLAAAMTNPGPDALAQVGGLGAWLNWPGGLISLAGFNVPLESVKQNRARVGVHYQDQQTGRRQTVDPATFTRWQTAARATIQLPLNQAPQHYAPVDDINRAVAANLAWDQATATAWGVVEGGGLRRARQASVQGLLAAGRTGLYLGGLAQPLPREEWQRTLHMTVKLLPPALPRMITVRTSANLSAAVRAGIDIIVTDLPLSLAERGHALTPELTVLTRPQFVPADLLIAGLAPQALAALTQDQVPLATRLLTLHNLTSLTAWIQQYQGLSGKN